MLQLSHGASRLGASSDSDRDSVGCARVCFVVFRQIAILGKTPRRYHVPKR